MSDKEIKRLEEVKKYLQIDLENIKEFKEITDLASQLCETPISLITLLDKDINWIRVASGADITDAPRETSFCQYAIQQDDVLIIPDATKDKRFDNNPLVHQNPKVRFYAGAPLVLSNGYRLGTLCLFDIKPNSLTDLQKTALSVLSRQVVYLLELQLSEKRLKRKLQEIEEKNESLRQIAHMQSHSIRHPLASIIGLVNLVRDGHNPVDEAWLRMITDVTDILDSRIHAIVNETIGQKDVKLMQFNKVVEEIEDYAILLLDAKGNIENWNAGAQKIKGYSSAEIVGRNFSEFYPASDREKGLPGSLLEEARKNKVARNIGWRVKRDGSCFWASVVITSIRDENGEVLGFLKVTRDLTSLKEVQGSLDVAEERNKRIIDEIEDYAIILLDADGNIEKWNKGAELIKGYTDDEAIGRNFSMFYSEQDIEKGLPQLYLEQARKYGRAHHEGWRIKKDGSKFWGSVVLTAIHDKYGEVIGFVKVTKDLSGSFNTKHDSMLI